MRRNAFPSVVPQFRKCFGMEVRWLVMLSEIFQPIPFWCVIYDRRFKPLNAAVL